MAPDDQHRRPSWLCWVIAIFNLIVLLLLIYGSFVIALEEFVRPRLD